MRVAEINRVTNETDVQLWLDLDGDGKESEIKTGIGFFDHMMTLFSRHSGIQMNLTCEGDTWVDDRRRSGIARASDATRVSRFRWMRR